MAMEGLTTCAVKGCGLPIWGYYNLCSNHRLKGVVAIMNDSSMVITMWYAEHAGEQGIIVLNDWALGHKFGGRCGFEAELARQGFVNVRNLATVDEHRAA